MKSFLILLISSITLSTFANTDRNEKFGSSHEAWEACYAFAEKYIQQNDEFIQCNEDIQTNQILGLDKDTFKVLKRFKYNPLVYGWVGKFGSNYEAWQACDEFADKYMQQKDEFIECYEDMPTNQILALDEDTLKVLEVFKY